MYHIGPPDEDETEYFSMSEKSSDDGSEAEYQDGFYMISMAQTLAENITVDNEAMESTTPHLSNLHVMRSEPHYTQYRLTVGEGYIRGQALIDTGSTDSNYLSLRLYNKLEKDLVHLTETVNHDVVVADGKTKLHIDKKSKDTNHAQSGKYPIQVYYGFHGITHVPRHHYWITSIRK